MRGGHYAEGEGEGDIPLRVFSIWDVKYWHQSLPAAHHPGAQYLPTEVAMSRHECFLLPADSGTRFPLPTGWAAAWGRILFQTPQKNCMKNLSGATGFWRRKAGSSRPARRVVDGEGAQCAVAHSLTKHTGGHNLATYRQTDRRPQRPCGHSHEKAGPGALDRKSGPAFVWGWLRS